MEGMMSRARANARGTPVVRTVPMPADANPYGDIFGGWVLAQMDIAGGIIAMRRAQGRVVTVAINAMSFHEPIKVGDVVSIYGHVAKIGRTSLTVALETLVQRRLEQKEITVTEGNFVFVAVDDQGRPRPVNRLDKKRNKKTGC
jgi:acyl-CoA thioesterase YciA